MSHYNTRNNILNLKTLKKKYLFNECAYIKFNYSCLDNWILSSLIAIVFIIATALPILVISAPLPRLSENEILERCYTQITGLNLEWNNSLRNKLHQERASSLCIQLLDMVEFDQQGLLINQNDKIPRAILKKFIDIHRSWFDQKLPYLSTFPEEHRGAVDIYDSQEPALFVTRNLFTKDHYSQVLQSNSTAVAIRDGSSLINNLPLEANGFLRLSRIIFNYIGEGQRLNSNVVTYSNESKFNDLNLNTIETPLIEIGNTIGIKLTSYQNNPLTPVIWTDILSTKATYQSPEISLPQAFLANKGGGALGSIPYIMTNFGHGFDYVANGAEKLPRRYILSVFKDFLCRQGPFVRSNDVSHWKSTLEASPEFRKREACLRCHVTLDQSAMILRNYRLGSIANASSGNFNDYRVPPILVKYNINTNQYPSEFWPQQSDPNFHITAPNGRLYFRSITGLIEDHSNVDNLEKLGSALTQTADYYACAAKRYFEYFTNNKIELYDPYDPSNSSLISSQTILNQNMRSFVIALGKELKSKEGNLKNLIKRIFESDYYSQGNFGQ